MPTRATRNSYDELKQAVEKGFARAFWCGSAECEAKIKEDTKATMRCIPLDQEPADAPAFTAANRLKSAEFSREHIDRRAALRRSQTVLRYR